LVAEPPGGVAGPRQVRCWGAAGAWAGTLKASSSGWLADPRCALTVRPARLAMRLRPERRATRVRRVRARARRAVAPPVTFPARSDIDRRAVHRADAVVISREMVGPSIATRAVEDWTVARSATGRALASRGVSGLPRSIAHRAGAAIRWISACPASTSTAEYKPGNEDRGGRRKVSMCHEILPRMTYEMMNPKKGGRPVSRQARICKRALVRINQRAESRMRPAPGTAPHARAWHGLRRASRP
jgi:hypothetical protein